MKYVNLGCGDSYHVDWINFDFVQTGPGVIPFNLVNGIPLPDQECDVVYHSHFLEHLRPTDALFVMKECRRILKPGGVLRVAVPDMEQICRLYLQKLQDALDNVPNSNWDYEWMKLELYDQMVREYQGGGMLQYLKQNPIPNEDFVIKRIGPYGRDLISRIRAQRPTTPSQHVILPSSSRLIDRLRQWLLAHLLGAEDVTALSIGRFRLAGEIHLWMYDRFSLAHLMRSVGFVKPTVQSADTSWVENWAGFNLDTLPDKIIRKPDSLFMEALVSIDV